MKLTDTIKEGRKAFNAREAGRRKARAWVTSRLIEMDFESITGLGQILYDSPEIILDDLGEPSLIKNAETGVLEKQTRTGTASRRYGAMRKLVERQSRSINSTPIKLAVEKGQVLVINAEKKPSETSEPEAPEPTEPETPETPETPEAPPEADETGEWLKEIRLLWDKAPTRGAQKAFLEQAVREFTGK